MKGVHIPIKIFSIQKYFCGVPQVKASNAQERAIKV